eukprot:Pompholyxophrys_punicea_v1_NODE_1293_length_808_cov_7.852590.p2 type:complete len:110 gc:universal NODE_1293_length_808_cov_7.852590:256-585(+)
MEKPIGKCIGVTFKSLLSLQLFLCCGHFQASRSRRCVHGADVVKMYAKHLLQVIPRGQLLLVSETPVWLRSFSSEGLRACGPSFYDEAGPTRFERDRTFRHNMSRSNHQ